MVIYFAYGSNMLRQRLSARVGQVEALGKARLSEHRLTFDKKGGDGSGKCTVAACGGERVVWGALFGLHPRQCPVLHEYEGPGYEIQEIVVAQGTRRIEAYTYVAVTEHVDPTGRPFCWYKSLVLAGALQARLPQGYLGEIRSAQAVPDLDSDRKQENDRLISTSGYQLLVSGPG